MRCLYCQQPFSPPLVWRELFSLQVAQQPALCQACRRQFEPLKPGCPTCGRPQTSPQRCQDCQRWQRHYPTQLLHNHASYHYNPAMHDLMVQYKRYRDYQLALVLQTLIAPAFRELEYDYYVPVPSAPEHLARRQFDTISAVFTGLVPLSPLLKKIAGTSPQGEKQRRARLQTPQAFYLRPLVAPLSPGARYLLLDDIYTTGRTLYHARDALKVLDPQAQIESLTICR